MITFSTNPDVAEQQMNAIIFYLTAFGYIDGEFDFTEKTFVRIYIRQLVAARAKAAMPDAEPKTRDEVVSNIGTIAKTTVGVLCSRRPRRSRRSSCSLRTPVP